ncbi:MAG: hypothetical protein EF807_06380 [Candidatus Methanolliviera hydrocarbonicum]|uniref:Sodium:solute symporter family protein n=1 Tax=Candidatus Methanolliviera hydrocarbonicum TaxID=2491085 RepID=A0A520KWT3_9EURY|nr:MAG: hypothetical protein EF807_06380 [Candidatus Methanolliviera hydrocarbonicum]
MIEPLDWVVIGVYLAILLWLGFYLAKGQKSEKDYFLGGRNIPSWAIAMSTTATQCGAISMMSIPAFVALASGGGLKWLQLELAVPLAVILVMSLIIPTLYRSKITTAYEYLERRFSPATRSLISFMFLLSRGLGNRVCDICPLISVIYNHRFFYSLYDPPDERRHHDIYSCGRDKGEHLYRCTSIHLTLWLCAHTHRCSL